MPRYVLTTQDRSKGGKATAAKKPPEGYKSYMQYLGTLGLQALADRYFRGNVRKAGEALSRIGNFVTDPFPLNGAWQDGIFRLPPELFAKVMGHCEPDEEGVPF